MGCCGSSRKEQSSHSTTSDIERYRNILKTLKNYGHAPYGGTINDLSEGSFPMISVNQKYWVNEHGQLHRRNEPALIRPSGNKEWYTDGHIVKIITPDNQIITNF